jgi:hypothetical protein
MRTMNQQFATSFRCARRTLHRFIELIRASLVFRLFLQFAQSAK